MNYSQDDTKSNRIINDLEVTPDVLGSRAGLALFVRYLRNIVLLPSLEDLFCKIRKSRKGQDISEIFEQLFCFSWMAQAVTWSILKPLKRMKVMRAVLRQPLSICFPPMR